MKKIVGLALSVFLIASGFTGCKKIVKAIFPGLEVDAPSVTVDIPIIFFAPSGEIPFPTYTQAFNLDSVVRANTAGAFGANDVMSVKVKQMFFTVKNPDQENNLSNFESVRFAFSSNTNTTPAEIANFTFPNTFASSFSYTPENPVDLRPYLNGNELRYHVFGKVRRTTSKPMSLTVRVTLRVA